MEHVSLLVVELVTVSIGATRIYNRFYRDWCGYRLIPQIAIQLLIPMVVVAAFYTELFHALLPFVSSNFKGILALAAAQVADLFVSRWFPHKNDAPLLRLAWSVASRISDKKVKVVNAILGSDDPHALISDIVHTSALPFREQENLLVLIHVPVRRPDVFLVLDKLGLAHVKTFVLGGKNAK
jgi:predicted neutral ceramidase superfamily lipid hydrolase